MAKQNLEKYIENATNNIVEDRAATKTLLMAVMKFMQTGPDRHKEVGLIAAKYLETLQRSNEQLVKLASLLQKQEKGIDGISDQDREDLFDLINQKEQE